MSMRYLMAAVLLMWTAGCKDRDDSGKPAADEPASEPRSVDEGATDDASEPSVDRAPVLGDQAYIAYRADTGEAAPATWTIEGTDIALRVSPLEGDESSFVAAQVMAKVGDGEDAVETGIYTCKSLNKDAGGYVDFMLRAEHLHVRCINPGGGAGPGDTEAARFAFDSSQDAVVAAGNYSGEGVVDPDTIELDEGE